MPTDDITSSGVSTSLQGVKISFLDERMIKKHIVAELRLNTVAGPPESTYTTKFISASITSYGEE